MRPKRSSQLSYTPGGPDTVAPGTEPARSGKMGAVEWFSASDDWLSRWVFERGLAITYVIAFAVVLNQFRPLLGEHGLLPVPRFLAAVPFRRSPSLFHWRYSDRLVVAVGLGRDRGGRPPCCSRSRSGRPRPLADGVLGRCCGCSTSRS